MMRQNPRLFRLSATVAIGALLCNAVLPAATAQPAPPPAASTAAQPDQNQADPPARVGRIASRSGAVSFRTSADTQWSAASPNYPVSAGNAFWTEPTSRAELEISACRIDLSGQTEFDLTALDASGLQAVAPQGELYFRLLDLAPNEVWTVQTPRGTVRLTAAGRYDIVVGTTEQPTQITVLDGMAEFEGPGVSLKVTANQTATVTGTDTFQGTVGVAERDAFIASRLAAERPPARTATSSVSTQLTYMSGAEDLSGYGEWSQAPDYGQVWYPPVSAGWVPYRDGNWSYVAPWGWTWVDSEPWGFAPFHYGRWARFGGRWGWVPGDTQGVAQAVYAPALVAFLGISAGIAVGAAIAGGSVGWVPLGPGEAYHPWYHSSQNYLQQINTGHVRDLTTINNNVTINNFANRAAATSVPASVMTGSRPVRASARPISAQAFASARPMVGQQLIRPTVATLGVTPAVARQLNLQPGGGVAPRRPAPGPVVPAQATFPANGNPARPALAGPHGERPGAPARPGEPTVSGPGAGRAPGGTPPLAVPGTRPAGLPEPAGARPGGTPATVTVPGVRPEGAARPGPGPEPGRAPGIPPLTAPGARPAGVPAPREGRPGEPPATSPSVPRPEGTARPAPGPEPTNHPPIAERPANAQPAPPRAAAGAVPHPGAPPPHPNAPPSRAAAPPPHVVTPSHAAPPRPAAPPPRAAPPRPASPPPRAAPPPRPAAAPPHAAPPAPHPQAAPAKKPGEH